MLHLLSLVTSSLLSHPSRFSNAGGANDELIDVAEARQPLSVNIIYCLVDTVHSCRPLSVIYRTQ